MSDDASRLDLVSDQFSVDASDDAGAIGASFMASIVNKSTSIVQQLSSGDSDPDMVVDQLTVLKRSISDDAIQDKMDVLISNVRDLNDGGLDASQMVKEAFSASQNQAASHPIESPPDDLFPPDSTSVSTVS